MVFVTDPHDLLRGIEALYTSGKINASHSAIYNRRANIHKYGP